MVTVDERVDLSDGLDCLIHNMLNISKLTLAELDATPIGQDLLIEIKIVEDLRESGQDGVCVLDRDGFTIINVSEELLSEIASVPEDKAHKLLLEQTCSRESLHPILSMSL